MFGFEIIDMPIISMYMYMTFVDMLFFLYTLVLYMYIMMCFVSCGSPDGMNHDALITWLVYHMFIHEVIYYFGSESHIYLCTGTYSVHSLTLCVLAFMRCITLLLYTYLFVMHIIFIFLFIFYDSYITLI